MFIIEGKFWKIEDMAWYDEDDNCCNKDDEDVCTVRPDILVAKSDMHRKFG